jgi:uncharacterized protein YbjT (DUF2867 family)
LIPFDGSRRRRCAPSALRSIGDTFGHRGQAAPEWKENDMKIVVIGGTGLIGSKVVRNLEARGHEVLAASPQSGVDTITGEGVAEAVAGADVVLDVANSPSFADDDVMAFFTTAGHHLLDAEAAAGVGHHVVLSIVGVDRLPDSGYMRAKVAQEEIAAASGVPYTIVRSTQFFEFLRGIADAATEGDTVRVSPATVQPIAAEDVAALVTDAVLAAPVGGTVEIGGPATVPLSDLVAGLLAADGDPRTVVADPHARYYGAELDDSTLTTGPNATLAPTTFEHWLATAAKRT